MDLNFFKELTNNIKENKEVKEFINQLGEFLEQRPNKGSNSINEENILKQIENERNVSLVSRNKIRECIDDVITKYSGRNDISNKEIINEIEEFANNVLDKQDTKLKEYRKEGHIYVVEEDVNNRIYLWDTTDKPSFTIEEVDFPENLKDQATEGAIFKYTNGEYKLYKE
ncbi:MAG: hypothetical protein HFJ17_04050 [Clostridia bacterium]|nr:hypothetical protein [Clostridia bacterium]